MTGVEQRGDPYAERSGYYADAHRAQRAEANPLTQLGITHRDV